MLPYLRIHYFDFTMSELCHKKAETNVDTFLDTSVFLAKHICVKLSSLKINVRSIISKYFNRFRILPHILGQINKHKHLERY